SLDITNEKCYNYEYEEGRLVRATEANVAFSGEVVTSKAVVNTVRYYYDSEGKMTKKVISPANGAAQTVYYETADDNTVVKFSAGGRTVTSHSKTDSFGRKVFDELQIGTGFVSRQFHYHAGEATEEHTQSNILKSSPTTQLVSQIVLTGGRTISYEYDGEERITKVDDSVDGITTYTYDALGQLVTETVNGITTKFEYDNYGNILAKGVVDETDEIAEATKITYAYGDEHWHDLLTAYDGQSITYDAQGNPTSYLGHTLTWEKGRQLKKFDGNTYTYNANGIRTSKTVDGIRHDYVLDGVKILREAWGDNTLVPLYDNEEGVCGILYNNEPYYFVKNLQGDVIAIVNKDAETVAKYSYDAWGVPAILQDTSNCQIATINPFRYRGYYYDAEIGLYYLQSRYYDPIVGRFINADDSTYVAIDKTVLSCNILTYCKNAPSSSVDNSGFNSGPIEQGAYQWAYMLSAVVPAVAAAKIAIITAIKSALAFLWNVFVVVGLVLLVIILIAAICTTAAKVLGLVQEAVKKNKYKNANGYVVYVLTRKKNDPSRIFYVGRTKNFPKRMRSHSKYKSPCQGYIVVVCKTYAASRAIEQAVLSACIVSNVFAIDKGSIPNGSNRMRGIAKDSVNNFKNNLSDLTSLMTCTSDSDLLNLMGF
ncbi:MAG: GIY-YIG nuclease family protein, partial [Oscillospiraceae bacterium]|nr:GIY-YIG nuclease family protein [Oscillospiraceae bacterium]